MITRRHIVLISALLCAAAPNETTPPAELATQIKRFRRLYGQNNFAAIYDQFDDSFKQEFTKEKTAAMLRERWQQLGRLIRSSNPSYDVHEFKQKRQWDVLFTCEYEKGRVAEIFAFPYGVAHPRFLAIRWSRI